MLVCWRLGPASGIEISAALARQRNFASVNLIATLLVRVVRKGYLSMTTNPDDGRSRIYTPLISESEGIRAEIRALLYETLARDPRYLRMLVEELARTNAPAVFEGFREELLSRDRPAGSS